MPVPDRTKPVLAARAAVHDPLAEARKRLIVALDVPDSATAAALIDRLEDTCDWFKVGLELFVASGPSVLDLLLRRGHSIFLDLKFHDIPNTVAGAVRSAATLGARMINVHAGGGPAMLAAARDALANFPDPPELLAVTMLTSMDATQVSAVGIDRSPANQVELMAHMAMAQGILGFVCSAQEVATLRTLTGPAGILVTPGIRPAGADIGDQSRIATPAEAIRLGASYLVVGRPITHASNPAEAAKAVLLEMATAL